MHPASILLSLPLLFQSIAFAQNTSTPGYDGFPTFIPSTVAANETLSFGTHYAVLNLDLINAIVGALPAGPATSQFISNVENWIDTVHAQNPPPLSIFTRIFFSNSRQPEIGPNAPFRKAGGSLGNSSDPNTQIFPSFTVNETAGDVVLDKTRYYAGAGNALEEILRTQGIDTVILSGVRTSGVILATASHLFDLDYNVYVIANNTIESAPDPDSAINTAILAGILPKLPANVITIEQAIAGLANSGPAVY